MVIKYNLGLLSQTINKLTLSLVAVFVLSFVLFSCENKGSGYSELKPISKTKNLQAIVEIPAGTAKVYQYDRKENGFKYERKNGKDVKFEGLAFPFNFGFIPSTKAAFTVDKDNPELDVVIIGEKASTSSLVEIKLIGAVQFAPKDSIKTGLSESILYNVLIAVPFDEELATINVDSFRDLSKTHISQRKIIELYLEDFIADKGYSFYAWQGADFAKNLVKSCMTVKDEIN